MEELITLKHDALAIVEVSYHGMAIPEQEPLYISCEEERQYIRKAISNVRNTVASD